MKNSLLIVSLAVIVIVLIIVVSNVTENFQSETSVRNEGASGNSGSESNSGGVDNSKLNKIISLLGKEATMSDYVRKTNIERAARSAARQYCPVDPNYDPSQFIKKTEIPSTDCPRMPDLKNFVLKSTIPPATKCPSCICPKVNVSAGFCKKCPDPSEICPKPEPCNADNCRNVIKCPPPPSCPKHEPLKCPPPAACPKNQPCPEVKRCPPNQCPKCKYYGLKTVDNTKTIEELLLELLNTDDQERLKRLRALLGMTEAAATQAAATHAAATQAAANDVPSPSNAVDTTYSVTEQSIQLEPVVDYDNKCVDDRLLYSAVGILGSQMNN
jgi:hypothetical protein